VLEKYQIAGAEFLAKRKHALLADDMGLGKTAQAITACDMLELKNILVVCPASVKGHWEDEFEKWSTYANFIHKVESARYRVDPDANIVIVNYDMLLKDLVFKDLIAREWDVLICDEAHYLKTLTSERSKRTLGKFGLVQRATYKWLLTGTPIQNRPVDLFPMLYVLNRKALGRYDDFEKFVMYFCDGYYDRHTNQPRAHGSSNEKELAKSLEGFMLRRTLENELPETTVQVVRLKKEISLEKIESKIQDQEDFLFKPMDELGALASLRQEIALAKMQQCVNYIKDTLKTIDKVVVFAYHRAVISGVADKLKQFKPVKFYGGLTSKQREEAKDKFINDPKCKVFIGQLTAAGTGLDGLQKVCHHMIFVEIDWSPYRQCIGRLKRKGQKKDKVIVQILVCKDSMEEAMLGTVKSKLNDIDNILGDKK